MVCLNLVMITSFLTLYMNCAPSPKSANSASNSSHVENQGDINKDANNDANNIIPTPTPDFPPLLPPDDNNDTGSGKFPQNGLCGTGIGVCSIGDVFKIPDTSTEHQWICKGHDGGKDQFCSLSKNQNTNPPTPNPVPSEEPFKCIDNDLNMLAYYNNKKWDIIAAYGLFFGRSPEKAGFDYWMTDPNYKALHINWDHIVLSYYGSTYSNLKYNPTNSNARSWLSNVYLYNWGTSIDSGGADYWSPRVVEYTKVNSNPAGFLLDIYNSLLQARCDHSHYDDETKKITTLRHIVVRSTLLIGEYVSSKNLKTYDLSYELGEGKLQYFYRNIISQTVSTINNSKSQDSKLWLEIANSILNQKKMEVDSWVNLINN